MREDALQGKMKLGRGEILPAAGSYAEGQTSKFSNGMKAEQCDARGVRPQISSLVPK